MRTRSDPLIDSARHTFTLPSMWRLTPQDDEACLIRISKARSCHRCWPSRLRPVTGLLDCGGKFHSDAGYAGGRSAPAYPSSWSQQEEPGLCSAVLGVAMANSDVSCWRVPSSHSGRLMVLAMRVEGRKRLISVMKPDEANAVSSLSLINGSRCAYSSTSL